MKNWETKKKWFLKLHKIGQGFKVIIWPTLQHAKDYNKCGRQTGKLITYFGIISFGHCRQIQPQKNHKFRARLEL